MPSPLPPSSFGPVVDPLLEGPPAPLDAGRPVETRRARLESLTAGELCDGRVRDRDAAAACLAGLWLWNGFLEESHALSQRLQTPEGSWWHGILHRREGDFGNAGYWFGRIGAHPLLRPIGRAVARLVPEGGAVGEAAFLGGGTDWDPVRFTRLCESIASGRDRGSEWLARRAAATEWRMLFADCLARARDSGLAAAESGS